MTTTIFINRFTPTAPDPPRWEKTEDGFLRCRARVLMETVMPYHRDELEQLPDGFKGEFLNMYVPLEEMQHPDALRSLEGMPVVAGDHTWLTPEIAAQYSMGQVAGTPTVDGKYLICNLLITNPDAIEAIENGRLSEISAGYRAETVFENGTYSDKEYAATQRSIRFNHIAIIPKGMGRAGQDVRILNKKQIQEVNKSMSDELQKKMVRVKLRNTGKYVNVAEEDAPAMEQEDAAQEERGRSFEETTSQLEEKTASLQALQAEIEELKGELSVYKEKLDELMSEESIEHAAEGMMEEQGEAEDIVENALPDEADEDKKKKEEFKNSLKKIHGQKLYNAVLTAIGVTTEGMSPDALRGAFKAQFQITNAMKGKGKAQKVAGQGMFQNMQKDHDAQPAARSGHERLGFKVVK